MHEFHTHEEFSQVQAAQMDVLRRQHDKLCAEYKEGQEQEAAAQHRTKELERECVRLQSDVEGLDQQLHTMQTECHEARCSQVEAEAIILTLRKDLAEVLTVLSISVLV